MYKILAINPGSTSTKIGLYEGENLLFSHSIDHSAGEIQQFKTINDQYNMRYQAILEVLKEKDFDVKELSCIVGRGGPVAPLSSGAYVLDEALVDKLRNDPMTDHASLLGGIIAYEMAGDLSIPSYIYDAVSTDELDDIARLSGMKEIERQSLVHTLNMRASGIKVAKEMGKNYEDMNFIIAHLGGGLSISVHRKGKMVDILSDDEGAFSPERSGVVPSRALAKMCYKHDFDHISKLLKGKGGLVSYLNTNDAREVEKMIQNGDEYAKKVYEAMAYQIAKGIGELAPVVEGKVDAIVITGGMAYSEMLMDWIVKRVEFIAPVKIVPGENELESLAMGGLRVLKGEETAHKFLR